MDWHHARGEYCMLGQWSDRLRRRISHRAAIALVITLSVLVGATSYAFVGYLRPSAAGHSACRRQPMSATSVLSGSPAELAAEVANSLLGCASSVVVANDDPASVAAALPLAEKAHAPLLLSSPLSATATSIVSFRGAPVRRPQSASSASTLAALREINDLHPRNVLVVGLKTSELSAEMPGARVTSNPAGKACRSPSRCPTRSSWSPSRTPPSRWRLRQPRRRPAPRWWRCPAMTRAATLPRSRRSPRTSRGT